MSILSFFLSFDTALPPREDYVQVDCVLKPRYKKCTEKEKIKMIVLKRMYRSSKKRKLVSTGHTLCNQLLLELSVYPFNTLQVCYRLVEDVHVEIWCHRCLIPKKILFEKI